MNMLMKVIVFVQDQIITPMKNNKKKHNNTSKERQLSISFITM